jgi:hypothetical protein
MIFSRIKIFLYWLSYYLPFATFKYYKNAKISLINNVPYRLNATEINTDEIDKFFLLSKKKLKQNYTTCDIELSKKNKNSLNLLNIEDKIFFPTFPNYFLFFIYFFNIIFFFKKKKILIVFEENLYDMYKKDINLILNKFKNFNIIKINLSKVNFININNIYLLKKNFPIKSKIPLSIIFNAKHGSNYYETITKNYLNKSKIKKIYLTRDNLSDRRKLINNYTLVNFLKKKNYYILNPAKVSIDELIILMKDVESVVMQSGSSMNALFFIKKSARILNIHNETGDSDIWVKEISNILGFKYFLFRGKNVNTPKIHNIVDNSNFKIDINQFEYCYNFFFKNS